MADLASAAFVLATRPAYSSYRIAFHSKRSRRCLRGHVACRRISSFLSVSGDCHAEELGEKFPGRASAKRPSPFFHTVQNVAFFRVPWSPDPSPLESGPFDLRLGLSY